MADYLANTSMVHQNFSGTMRGSVDVGGTPNWQKTSGHIPGTTPARASTPTNFSITGGTAKQLAHFPNALEAVYHN